MSSFAKFILNQFEVIVIVFISRTRNPQFGHFMRLIREMLTHLETQRAAHLQSIETMQRETTSTAAVDVSVSM